jgi:phosphoribosylanthranilate isomerase
VASLARSHDVSNAMSPIIQIAGVRYQKEAALLCSTPITHLGFPLRLPDGREDLSEADAKAIIGTLDARVTAVLITYLDKSAEIIELAEYLGVGGVQLHGPIAASEVVGLRSQRPHFFLIKSLIVQGETVDDLVAEVAQFHPVVDAFITDTYDPTTGRSGATGKTHAWEVSRRLGKLSPKPVILAGGLTPENVRAGILSVHPAGVDVHTGVEGPDGRKVLTLVEHFVAEARAAFRLIQQGG